MGSALTNLLYFIVAISILVAVHEFGHYIVGRWAGMKVLRFSIGFGKPIWSRRVGPDDTEYCIASIPLGGYVRFLDSRESDIDPADEGRAFDQRPIPARIAVLLAGPGFNRVGGEDVLAWDGALIGILDGLVSERRIAMTLEDEYGARRQAVIEIPNESAASLTEPGVLFEGLGFMPGPPPVVIGNLQDGGAALAAGLRDGDRIVAIDDQPIAHFRQLIDVVEPLPGQRVSVHYVRDQSRQIAVATLGERTRDGTTTGFLGVGYLIDNIGPARSFASALEQTWAKSIFTLQMLGRMLTGDVSIKNISGPINIAQYAGESAERGFRSFVDFLILISISLGILNLLPIPVLDGGQIVYQVAELLKGSPLTDRAQIIGQQVGILALLLLMSFAFYNDIAGILS